MSYIIVFFLGICALQLFHHLPNLLIPVLVIIAAFLGSVFLPKTIGKLCLFCGMFGLGFVWILANVTHILAWQLSPNVEGKTLTVIGDISSFPVANALGDSFEFTVSDIAAEKVHSKIKLSWYGVHPKLAVGDRWQLFVRLKAPHGNYNPGGFDYEKYLLSNKLRATGYVVAKADNKLLRQADWYYCIAKMRQFVRDKMLRMLADDPLRGALLALVVGDQSLVEQTQWQVLRATGTSYLLAIAGLHIGLVATAAYLLAIVLWRRSLRLLLLMPVRRIGALVGMAAASYYALLSGMSVPTQRALVMLGVYTLALLIHRNISSWRILLLALFVVLWLFPLAVLEVGFWLSFVAAAFVIYVTSGRLHLSENTFLRNATFFDNLRFGAVLKATCSRVCMWVAKYARLQIAVGLGIAPLTLLFFQQLSGISIIANLIALPLVCSVVVPLCLLGTLTLFFADSLGKLLLLAASKIMSLVWLWLAWLSQITILNWQYSITSWLVFLSTILGIVLILAPQALQLRFLGCIYLLPLWMHHPPKPPVGEFWLTLLDVGQGLSAVVQTANHTLVYDAGPKFFSGDAGESIIVPFLRYINAENIDTLVVSHADDDHSGGVNSLLAAVKVGNILASDPAKIAITKVPLQSCHAGQQWQWDGVNFSMLYPEQNVATMTSDNDASCVLKIAVAGNSVLFTGDIEQMAEKQLLNNSSNNLAATLLVAPHHGSNTSSTQEFITAVHPHFVIFAIGYRNHFHFPAKPVIARYMNNGSKMYYTDVTGALKFKVSGKASVREPELYRMTNMHYWSS